MAERVHEDDVRYVASLARLALDPARVPQLARELNGILEHMDALARVSIVSDTIAAIDRRGVAMPLRDDVAGTSTSLALSLSQIAPPSGLRDGFFLVPRLSTHEDSGEPHA